MNLFVAGLSYKTTPVEVREQLAVHRSRLPCGGCRLKLAGNLSEVVLLSTCNRVEIYGVTPRLKGTVNALFQQLSGSDFDFSPYLYFKEGDDAVSHLFSVASGLDSMVLGETEITGQVKHAYLAAQEARADRQGPEPHFSIRPANGQGNPDPHRHRPRRHFRGQRGGGAGRTDF